MDYLNFLTFCAAPYQCRPFFQEECSFVSLRDVKRVLDVMTWFYERRNLLFHFMDELALKEMVPNSANDDEEEPEYEVRKYRFSAHVVAE